MRNRKNRCGLTLVELIIAMVLVAIVSVVGLQFLVYAGNFSVQPKLNLIAANFARETMENLYLSSNLQSTSSPVNVALPTGNNNGSYVLLHDNYSGSRNYTITNSSDNSYRIITVNVDWSR